MNFFLVQQNHINQQAGGHHIVLGCHHYPSTTGVDRTFMGISYQTSWFAIYCTQVHSFKSWTPDNYFWVIIYCAWYKTLSEWWRGWTEGKQDNWLDIIWFPPGARAELWIVKRLAIMSGLYSMLWINFIG